MRTTNTWTFSTLDEHKAAEQEMLDRVRYAALENGVEIESLDSMMHGVRVALEEALVNHLKHGNQLDPAKTVTCDMVIEPGDDGLLVSFDSKDEGKGFDPADVPDPTAPENLERASGRGLLLIGHYAKSLEYLEGGTRLKMSFLFARSVPGESAA